MSMNDYIKVHFLTMTMLSGLNGSVCLHSTGNVQLETVSHISYNGWCKVQLSGLILVSSLDSVSRKTHH